MRAGGLPGHCCPGPCHADLWAGLWWGAGPDCCPPMSLSVGTGGIETAVCALWGPPAQGLGLAPGGPPDTPGLAHTGVGAMTGGQSGVGQRPPASLCPPCPPGPFALPAGKPLPCSPGALRSGAADRWVGHALLPRCPGQAPASGSGREAYSCYLRSTTVGVELGQPPAQATPFLELGGGRWVALPHPPWPVPPAGVYLEPRLLEHTVSPSAADVLVAR